MIATLSLLLNACTLAILVFLLTKDGRLRPKSSHDLAEQTKRSITSQIAYLTFLRLETGSEDPLADLLYLEEILKDETIRLEDYGISVTEYEGLRNAIYQTISNEKLEEAKAETPTIFKEMVEDTRIPDPYRVQRREYQEDSW